MDEYRLGSLFVTHQDLMTIFRWITPLGQALPAGDILACGQVVGRHVGRVVDAADDNGPVGVAVLKCHHHLVSHPRPEHRAPTVARP